MTQATKKPTSRPIAKPAMLATIFARVVLFRQVPTTLPAMAPANENAARNRLSELCWNANAKKANIADTQIAEARTRIMLDL